MRCLKFWRVLYTILPPAFIGAPMVAALLFLGSRRAAGQKRRSAGRRGCPAPSRSRFRSDRRKKSENFSKSRGRPSSRCRNLLGRRGCPAPSRSRFRSDRRKKNENFTKSRGRPSTHKRTNSLGKSSWQGCQIGARHPAEPRLTHSIEQYCRADYCLI